MTETLLPRGLTMRRPALEDAAAIHALVAAYNERLVGFPDYTLEDARDELAEPGFDLLQDGWLVHGDGGDPIGYGAALRTSGHDCVFVDVVSPDPAVREWLLTSVIDRGRRMAEQSGDVEVILDAGVYRVDEPLRSAYDAHGFEPTTAFLRMRIDHDGPPRREDLRAPDGVRVKVVGDDLDLRRQAHRVRDASFSEHHGSVPSSYEDWAARQEARSSFDWGMMTVAEHDGSVVGMLSRTNQFVPDDDCGYVATLGVLDVARGRGIAKAMLRDAFAADAEEGRIGTILHVDSNNTTPALGLYESVGMRTVLVVDSWRRTVPV